MFLNKTNNYFNNMNDIINESYEYLLEAQNYLQDIDIKMIKCEHTCIINENMTMLREAEEEHKSKVKETIKAVWNKIVITVQNFIITINKVITKFKTKFLNKEFKEKLDSIIKNKDSIIYLEIDGETYYKHVYDKEKRYRYDSKNKKDIIAKMTKEEYDAVCTNPLDVVDDLESLAKVIESHKIFNVKDFNQYINNSKLGAENRKEGSKLGKEMTGNDILNIYATLTKYGPNWIKSLEKIKRLAKSKISDAIKNNDNENPIYFQRAVNKVIFRIQRIMTACLKVCFAVKNQGRAID